MAHIIAIALTLAWVIVNIYLWHVIRSREALLAVSVVMGSIYVVPFWFYITSRDRASARQKIRP